MRNEVILQKMIGYIDKIQSYIGDITYEAFAEDMQFVDACVQSEPNRRNCRKTGR